MYSSGRYVTLYSCNITESLGKRSFSRGLCREWKGVDSVNSQIWCPFALLAIFHSQSFSIAPQNRGVAHAILKRAPHSPVYNVYIIHVVSKGSRGATHLVIRRSRATQVARSCSAKNIRIHHMITCRRVSRVPCVSRIQCVRPGRAA